MKICGNCGDRGLWDSYLLHEKLGPTNPPPQHTPPAKLYRCRECQITYSEAEYEELRDAPERSCLD